MADPVVLNDLDLPELGGQYFGAVGHIVSAVLQTGGLYAQGAVLRHFQPLLETAGALIYVVALIGALLSFAFFGNYRKGLYLFIGPAVFFWMLNSTVEGSAVQFRVGERASQTSKEEQIKFLSMFSDPSKYDTPPRLSWFFALWDNVVSEITQNTVALLIDTKNKDDLLKVARERALSQIFVTRITDPLFIELVSVGVMGYCADLTNLNFQRANSRDEVVQAELLAQYDKAKKIPFITLSKEATAYLKALGEPEKEKVSCDDIWNYVRNVALKKAQKWLTEGPPEREEYQIYGQAFQSQINNSIKSLFGGESSDDGRATRAIAAYLLKNAMAHTNHAGLTAQIAGRAPFNADKYNGIFGTVATAESEGGFLKIVFMAGSIPYIQGLLLYLLAAAFPFFAIFLLMPGRFSAFFVWMALWVWVKSWDVGFALTYFVRDIFWSFLGRGINQSGIRDINWDDPGSVYKAILDNDPLASMNTYYTIISLLTVSVPFLTAHLCLGATNLFDAFKNSIDKNATRFAWQMSTGKRRDIATKMNVTIDRKEAERKKSALAAAQDNSGSTKDGVNRKSAGDGTAARFADGEAKKAGFEFHFSQDQMNRRGMMAALQGRRMSYSNNAAQGYIEAMVNEKSEDYVGRTAGSGIHAPWGSTKAKNDDTSTDLNLTPSKPAEEGDNSG